MKTLLTDHSFLNKENVQLLKKGDVLEFFFHTTLNGTKHEKVIFLGKELGTKTGVYDSRETKVKFLNFEYILPECFAGQIQQWGLRALEPEFSKSEEKEWFEY